nr:cation diffusion facilitator family transporter [Candidatus Chloroploca mongolica]
MMRAPARASLVRYAWLSISASVIVIGLKTGAYLITGSVGLLSDALESVTNLVAAVVALVVLTIAARPPDEEHAYGHDKAEYFSSGVEGGLILLAAVTIMYTAARRLLDPQPIEGVGLGLVIAIVASLINLGVARILMQAGKQHNSITLEADGHHLMTDVWTSVGVVVGVGAVALTGWHRLDPMIAIIVAANIIWSGFKLLQRSALGLLDTAVPLPERSQVMAILDAYAARDGVQFHALRTRQAASRRFVSVHVLVPGWWTVMHGHRLIEEIERDVCEALPGTTFFTHLEPLDDPLSFADQQLDREKFIQK